MSPDELLDRVAPPPPSDLLVALSGGPDSAVAAWVAIRTAPQSVRAVHVHHGNAFSDDLAAAAESVAARLGIGLSVVEVSVPAGPSWEGRARAIRWAALEEARRKDEVTVTGHHRDDLAETTFGHLIRGSGAAGLAAMAATRASVWRPLLAFGRTTIASAADVLDLGAISDPANEDLAHTRNQLRHEILPRLTEELNPQLLASLARTAHALAADDAFLENLIDPVVLSRDAWGAWYLPAPLVSTADASMAARLVRRLLRAARPPYAGSAAEIAAGIEVAGRVTRRRQIEGGWFLEVEGPWLVAHRGDVAAPQPAVCKLPGETDYGELHVVAAPVDMLTRRTSLVDPAAVGRVVELRSAGAGERIEIDSGSKLIRDVLAEAGVARRLRSAWPVAEANGRIVAVVGIRAAPWARGTLGEEGVQEIKVGDTQF